MLAVHLLPPPLTPQATSGVWNSHCELERGMGSWEVRYVTEVSGAKKNSLAQL